LTPFVQMLKFRIQAVRSEVLYTFDIKISSCYKNENRDILFSFPKIKKSGQKVMVNKITHINLVSANLQTMRISFIAILKRIIANRKSLYCWNKRL